jgi:hypothetical protein
MVLDMRFDKRKASGVFVRHGSMDLKLKRLLS